VQQPCAAGIRAAADCTGGPIDGVKTIWMTAQTRTIIDEVRALLGAARGYGPTPRS
jgi:hypothetical protein